jgi:hypothetical protein
MLDPQSSALYTLFSWAGQVLALRLGTRSELTCVCPSCPAHTISCTCNGGGLADPAAKVDFSVAFILFFLGLALGCAVGAGCVLLGCRFFGDSERASDEREQIQLKLRRSRK